MNIFVIIIIILLFGMIGILCKQKYKNEYLFYKFIKEFHQYYTSNLSLFKNNIIEIIDNYYIMHKNKNAKYLQIFEKRCNIYYINKEILDRYMIDKDDVFIVFDYLNNLGKNEYLFEKEKIKEFSIYINKKQDESDLNLKNKGELYFKLLLAIGVIVAIIIW